MATLKTEKTAQSVSAFLDAIPDEDRRRDCLAVLQIMKRATKAEPKMWGSSVVGFGDHHYKYESGREGDWFVVGFSPRKANLTLYFMSGLPRYAALLDKLGKHTTGKGCLHIKRLDDIDRDVLTALVKQTVSDLAGT